MNRVDNPHFTFGPDITTVLEQWRQQERCEAVYLARLRQAMAPSHAEHRLRHTLARHTAETSGIEAGLMRLVQDQQTRKLQTARRLLSGQPSTNVPAEPAPPRGSAAPSGPDFWWVRTEWTHSEQFRSATSTEALVFTGGPTGNPQHSWLEAPDTVPAQLRAVALFQISTERLPHSPHGRWTSEPSVDVVGGLLAGVCSESVLGVESSARCDLHVDHRIFQCRPRWDRVVPHVLGQAHTLARLVEEADSGATEHRALPGHVKVPSISFSTLDRTRPLWARLEIMLDARVRGGSFLWCYPDVRISTPQWELRPSS